MLRLQTTEFFSRIFNIFQLYWQRLSLTKPESGSSGPRSGLDPCLGPVLLGLHSPVLARILLSQFGENLPPLISNQIPCPSPLTSGHPGLPSARIPLPLRCHHSNFPSADPLTLLLSCVLFPSCRFCTQSLARSLSLTVTGLTSITKVLNKVCFTIFNVSEQYFNSICTKSA